MEYNRKSSPTYSYKKFNKKENCLARNKSHLSKLNISPDHTPKVLNLLNLLKRQSGLILHWQNQLIWTTTILSLN